jgi:SAM-dependent methyltransferase
MITTQIYLPDKHALAFYREKATSEFWDDHWSSADLETVLRRSKDDGLFIPAVKRYLPKGSVVLEGGCGMGQIVHALQYQGYNAIGIDFASKTIKNIKEAAPELDVRFGDVCNLDLPDDSLDGYISVGVIEHFWEGYQTIFDEMRRTLKPGGYLFVSFPFLSPLRKLKIALRQYTAQNSLSLAVEQERFYQFALDAAQVQVELETLGFKFVERVNYDGIKGLKDEVSFFKPILQEIYDGKRGQRWRGRLNQFLLPFAAHMALMVMQKK